ncbi:phosphate ABC transporter ATP-binding protein, partial [Enterococcus faecalis]|nr:phosphate ABC transporter ATP-binding protein [Enterococcus faecalis]
LRCFNRMHDLYPANRYAGELLLYPGGRNIVGRDVNPVEMRMRIGMVFQKPNPFPKSIFENVAFGLRMHGFDRTEIEDRVKAALKAGALWD